MAPDEETSQSSMRNPYQIPPDAPRLPPEDVPRVYAYWRVRLLSSTFLGYVMYYLVRKNIAMALPAMQRDLGYTKSDLGKLLSANDIVYGISKFVNGMGADCSNARYFMATGLLVASVANLAFGLSGTLWALGFWWILNGWFQGMGFPPCARILCYWFSPRERGLKWSIFAASQQVGAAGALILSGYLVERFGWRAVFLFPGFVGVLGSLFLFNRLRDTPGSLGLPPVDEYTGEVAAAPKKKTKQPKDDSFRQMLMVRVFRNPYVWMIACANFFVYVLRSSFAYWAPSYLHEAKLIPLETAGDIQAGFEIAGLCGAMLAGWISDRFTRGQRAPVCVVYMLMACGAVLHFSMVPAGHPYMSAVSLWLVGFTIYGPQFLVGVMMTDQSGKEAAATADGLAGLIGYASGVVSGWGIGYIVQTHGWPVTFRIMVLCGLASAALFGCCWKARPVLH